MNYTTVSAKQVVERVFGLLGNTISQDSDRFLGNIIEWIGYGLEQIGCLPAMERVSKNFTIKNGKVEIPCGLYLIESVAYNSHWLPYGSQNFNYDLHCSECVNESLAANLPYSYIVNPNWLQTNIPDDEQICITFYKYVTDSEGFPQIPNKEVVKEALFWLALRNLMLGGFEHPNREITYSKVEGNWLKYCGQAETDLAWMDKPKLMAFKNSWVRLIPEINAEQNFFATMNQPEILQQKFRNHRL